MDSTWESRCKDPAKPNMDLTYKSVEAGLKVGYLIYDSDVLIGWTGAGPKSSFPSMKSVRLGARLSPFTADTWVLGCIGLEIDLDYEGKLEATLSASSKKRSNMEQSDGSSEILLMSLEL